MMRARSFGLAHCNRFWMDGLEFLSKTIFLPGKRILGLINVWNKGW